MTDTGETLPGGRTVVYEAPDGDARVDVRLERETVWLSRRGMAAVFGTTPENILIHLRNVFSGEELEAAAATRDFPVVRTEGGRRAGRRIRHYSLDAVVSVGHRVNPERGAHFRQWAARTLRSGMPPDDAGEAVPELIARYADTWRLLLEYDEDRLGTPSGTEPVAGALDPDRAIGAIEAFRRELSARGEASALFGNRRDDALEAILGNVEQTMSGEPLYRSREEKAAHLLYFIVKDHPFTDGNKRIGALLFLLYLAQEGVSHRLDPRALTALTLLIAESRPASKDLMIRLVVSLLTASAE